MNSRRRFRKALSFAQKTLGRFYYVPYCAVCDEAVHPPLPSPFVCKDCLSVLPFRMGAERIEWEGPFPLYATFFYKDALPKLLISMKFAGRTDRAQALAPLMARTIRRHRLTADAIIPVPLHRRRKAERGYNQVSVLADCLASSVDTPAVDSLLVRHRFTERQSEAHSVKERHLHLQDAFRLDPLCPAAVPLGGRTVFLLDDVLTTGATMAEAARPLLEAGIHVTGLVAATGKDRYQGFLTAADQW
ncbi:MAG: ComF family protein [Clostridiaceae bacterium]|nr:ComF family protein [Clostridiaceae bacterium]